MKNQHDFNALVNVLIGERQLDRVKTSLLDILDAEIEVTTEEIINWLYDQPDNDAELFISRLLGVFPNARNRIIRNVVEQVSNRFAGVATAGQLEKALRALPAFSDKP